MCTKALSCAQMLLWLFTMNVMMFYCDKTECVKWTLVHCNACESCGHTDAHKTVV